MVQTTVPLIKCFYFRQIGTYDQNGIIISTEEQEQTLLEYVKKCVQRGGGSSVPEEEARRLLNKFEFQKMRWNER